ncbi:MAG: exodeoxyribonuclease-5, partial [Parvicella sp.]
AQLPPVGSPYSPALEKEFLEGGYGIPFGVIQLKQVVRQSHDSGILLNATQLRIQMLEEDYEIKIIDNNEDAKRVDGYTLQDDLEHEISRNGIENCIVICRSNKNSNLYNQQIRHRILYHEEQINTGDLMMVLKNNYHWIDPTSRMSFIANGDTIELMRIRKIHELYGFTFADVTVRMVDFPGEPEFDCKIILDAIMTNSASLTWEQQNQLFKSIEMDYSDIGNKKKRAAMVMKSPYYNALQVKFSYSVTCHKAQGGQWPIVFIDQGFLPPDGINHEYLRWLYTAITRASEKVYFVNFRDPNAEEF